MSENDNLPIAEEPHALAADPALGSSEAAPEVVILVPEAAPAVVEAELEVQPEPAPEPAKKIKNSNPVASEVGSTTLAGEAVKLSKLVYKANSRNSASVIAVKTRLIELGYNQAANGRIGWIDDYTVEALKQFQADIGLEVSGIFTRPTVEALLVGTELAVED